MKHLLLATICLFPALAFADPGLPTNPGGISTPQQIGAIPGASLAQYGTALGDGSDATSAITAALASSGSNVVHIATGTFGLAPGNYTATGTLSLVGDGPQSIIQLQGTSCTQTGALFSWISKSNLSFRNLTIDVNHCAASGNTGALNVTGGSNPRFENVNIINMGTGNWFGINLNGVSAVKIAGGRIAADAAQTNQNQAINLSSTFGPAVAVGTCTLSSQTMTCSAVTQSGFAPYEFLTGAGVSTGTAIVANPANSAGGVGTYSIVPAYGSSVGPITVTAHMMSDDIDISGVTAVNTGFLLNASRIKARGNNISGWQYGAGISTSPTLSPDAVLSGNTIHDSATGLDSNATYPNGLEIYGSGTSATGNIIKNVAASCVYTAGQNMLINSNQCTGAGKRSDGAGAPAFTLGWISATENSNGSTLIGNNVISDGTATTTFGVADTSQSMGAYVPAAQNNFSGANSPWSIQGGTSLGPLNLDNRVGNPCFAVDQRQNGTQVLPSGAGVYTVDRWAAASGNGGMYYQRVTKPMGSCGTTLQPAVFVQVTTPAANFLQNIHTTIEAQYLYDLGYGSGAPRTAIMAFSVNYPVAGTFPGFVQNPNAGRCYVFTYTVTAAQINARVDYAIAIPGDTSVLSTNSTAAGLIAGFDEGSGSNSQATALNTWQNGSCTTFAGLAAMDNNPGARATLFNISDVQFYPSPVALPWGSLGYGEDLRRAQRYFAMSFEGLKPAQNGGIAGAERIRVPYLSTTSTTVVGNTVRFPVAMRANPTVTFFSPSAATANCYDQGTAADAGAAAALSLGVGSMQIQCTIGAAAAINDLLAIQYSLNADF